MKTCTFNDLKKTTIQYNECFEEPIFWDGINRRSLRFECDEDVISLDELNTLLSNEENCKILTLTNTDIIDEKTGKETTHIYNDYTIKGKCSNEPLVSALDKETNANIYKNMIVFTLYRKTPAEKENELIKKRLTDLENLYSSIQTELMTKK